MSAPAKWIPCLSSFAFPPTFPPLQPLLSPPSPSSLGESCLRLGHESEGAEDLTHLLLSLNTISFQVAHWDAIVFLISPPRHMARRGRGGDEWGAFPSEKVGDVGACVDLLMSSSYEFVYRCGRYLCVFPEFCVCGPVGWVWVTEREKMCTVLPLWLMPEWDHQGCSCRWDVFVSTEGPVATHSHRKSYFNKSNALIWHTGSVSLPILITLGTPRNDSNTLNTLFFVTAVTMISQLIN